MGHNFHADAARELADKLIESLSGRMDSIVLYGSAARGVAGPDSDIDVLVIAPNPRDIRKEVSRICGDYVYERDFDVFISLLYLSHDRLQKLLVTDSAF